MKFALIQCSDGNFLVVSEHGDNLQAAEIAFHQLAAALLNESSVIRAVIEVVDEGFNVVNGLKAEIAHGEAAPVE